MHKHNIILKVSYTALLLSITIIIGLLEMLIPPIIPILPFIKIGFGNIVVIFTVIILGELPSITIVIIKSCTIPLLFGNPIMTLYSLPASLLSLILMILMLRLKMLGIPLISAIAACIHNLIQILVAFLIMGTQIVFSYVPYVLFAGLISGMITGIISYFLLKRIPNKLKKIQDLFI